MENSEKNLQQTQLCASAGPEEVEFDFFFFFFEPRMHVFRTHFIGTYSALSVLVLKIKRIPPKTVAHWR